MLLGTEIPHPVFQHGLAGIAQRADGLLQAVVMLQIELNGLFLLLFGILLPFGGKLLVQLADASYSLYQR